MNKIGDIFETDEGLVMMLVRRELRGDMIMSEEWEPLVNALVRMRMFSDLRDPETIYPYTWADALISAGWTPPWGRERRDES
jgi:hypothetical protein